MRTGGYAFLSERPPNIGAVQRFFLLHELGHLSPLSKYTSLRATFGCAPFFPIVIWAVPQVTPGWRGVILIVGFAFMLLFLRDFVWSVIRIVGRVLDEMTADRFGLTHLPPAERLEVANFFRERPLPNDDTLPPDGNQRRHKLFSDNLEHIRASNGEPEGLFGFPQPSKTEWPVLLSFAAVFFLAAFAPPATDVAVWFLAFVALTITFPLLSNLMTNRDLEILIGHALAEPASIPADRIPSWPEEAAWIGNIRHWLGLAPVLPKDLPKWMYGGA